MATPDEIDALEVSLVDWVGATNASTLLQLVGARPRSSDPAENPVVNTKLIAELHDAMSGKLDHELADVLLELAGYPTRWWVPSCPAVA